ncbi:uncharacterized protein LOC105262032 [Musca domestica]|uniref:Uncharacterized protein LOC105262032 n=1 Tax=Musca domestica TaxID=7370 RepID=A0A9J7D7F1_MUSDO|nr:uncharacterized protein LOC105262032 [Musca domestica]
MGNVHAVNCVLTSEDANNNLPNLMKRTCQRMSFKRGSTSRSSGGSDKSSASSSSSPVAKIKKLGKKRLVLNTMPRCSSFEDLSTALPSSKKSDNDPTYLLWKKAFEQRRPKPAAEMETHMARMRRRVHNMSSAVSGHLTPKGFPAFTMKRQQKKATKSSAGKENCPPTTPPAGVVVKQKKPIVKIPQHLTNKLTINGATVGTISLPPKMKMKSTTASVKPKYTLAPLNLLSQLPQNKQAIIIEQLYRDIKEFESRYDDQMESFIM